MTVRTEVKAHCPSCGAKYRLAADMIGRKARCAKCQTLFRIAEPVVPIPDTLSAALKSAADQSAKAQSIRNGDLKHPPTEDDIMRWLAEAENEADRERRIERDEDGLDAFDMPVSEQDASVSATTSRARFDNNPTSPRSRIHVNEDDTNLMATGMV